MRASFVIPAAVIVLCVAALIYVTHKNSYRSGFLCGKRFILTILRHVSPEAADKFRRDIMEQYQYDVFREFTKR